MARASEQIERVTGRLMEGLVLPTIIGSGSLELATLRTKLPRVARSDAPVLITAASGAEAERVARAVHYLSPYFAFPFVTVACGSLAEATLRRALFGPDEILADLFEPSGMIRTAAGGTLFLEGVEHLGAAAQGRLLRWLRERGPGDARVICGSRSDLRCLVEQGRFRADLYYRLNVIPLALPPTGASGVEASGTVRVLEVNYRGLQGGEGIEF